MRSESSKSFAVSVVWICLSATLALAQYATPQYQYPATQYPALPQQYPSLPQYPAEAYQAFPQQQYPYQQSQLQQHPSQHTAAMVYPHDHNYGTAAVTDSASNNYPSADGDPSWIVRPRDVSNGQNTTDTLQNVGVENASSRNSIRPPAKFVPASTARENAPADNSPTVNSSASSTSAPSDSNGTCSSCQNGECDSCNSNCCGCDSCDCDSCHHKCQPLIQIDDCCPLQCDDQPIDRYFGDCCWLQCHDTTITGWFDGGIMGNGRATDDHFNGPLTFPDRRGEGQANQMWLSIDRSAPADNCDWFIGGHMDYFFGSDYFFTTAAGLDGTRFGNFPRWNTTDSFLYGFAMPQLYAETDYGSDLKIKWGHFFTIIGYEVVPAIGNFFYSHSYTMQYGEPFTHTGMLASKTNDNWTWYGGITAGWNTFDADDRAGFLGGLTYTDKDWGSLALAVTTGDDSEFNFAGVGPFANRTMYSLVWSRNFTSRFTYVLQHDWGTQNEAQTFVGSGAQWYGINQYMFYKLNCCWTAGLRVEWFRDDDGFVVTGLRPGNAIAGASFPGNFYEVTAGLNYKANANLSIRPEVRWDWYDGETNQNPFINATLPYDAGTRSNQFTYGVDLVYQW